MKDTQEILYTAIYTAISAITDVYSAVPANKSMPYVYLGDIIKDEQTGAKDRFIDQGTIDISIYTDTDNQQGSKSEMLTLTNSIKVALKPTKASVLDLSPNFKMTVWYLSNEATRTETTKNKKAFINTIQYYYEIEQL